MSSLRDIATAMPARARYKACKRQRVRNQESAVYGAPVFAEQETPDAVSRFVRAELARHARNKERAGVVSP